MQINIFVGNINVNQIFWNIFFRSLKFWVMHTWIYFEFNLFYNLVKANTNWVTFETNWVWSRFWRKIEHFKWIPGILSINGEKVKIVNAHQRISILYDEVNSFIHSYHWWFWVEFNFQFFFLLQMYYIVSYSECSAPAKT